jgi:hypothetical protein
VTTSNGRTVAWAFSSPGVVCAQVITPGYRVILQAAGTPFVEYYTDLNGHAVFVAEYATYQDVPTVQPTNH